jgi:soluble lytic murein transglycosylase
MISQFHFRFGRVAVCVVAFVFGFDCARANTINDDSALALVQQLDNQSRSASVQLPKLLPEEHMRRAAIYLTNRAFADARSHYQALVADYPTNPCVPLALFEIGRSFYQERRYAEALPFFKRLAREFVEQEEGREGFYYIAPTLLRMGRPADGAAQYLEYASRFPAGERVESAYLNAIDCYREAGRPAEAIRWIDFVRKNFKGGTADINALFARLRLDVAGGNWSSAVSVANELDAMNFVLKVETTKEEVAYLRAYSFERAKQTVLAAETYQSLSDSAASYYGVLATERLRELGGTNKFLADARAARARKEIEDASIFYPAPFREEILKSIHGRMVDARLVLAIMSQESHFDPQARSPATARGLLQLTMDVAAQYGAGVLQTNVTEEALYDPAINITVGVECLAALTRLFPDCPEAVVASYNGGEDNVARWLARANQKNPGVFTAEIGFPESKEYVFKVMANYRAYKELYTADLQRR